MKSRDMNIFCALSKKHKQTTFISHGRKIRWVSKLLAFACSERHSLAQCWTMETRLSPTKYVSPKCWQKHICQLHWCAFLAFLIFSSMQNACTFLCIFNYLYIFNALSSTILSWWTNISVALSVLPNLQTYADLQHRRTALCQLKFIK